MTEALKIPVYYTPALVCQDIPLDLCPSAQKPALVISDWLTAGLPIKIFAPERASNEVLNLAHDSGYVRDVLAGRATNGYGNRLRSVSDALPWVTGSLLSAAHHALLTRSVAVSPTSGFHHARYARAQGFCTFNGLVATAAYLRQRGLVNRVAILDADFHYGDGTEDIIHKKGYHWLIHVGNGQGYDSADPERFLFELHATVRRLASCDLILYQAGADAHISDPLGGFLDDQQLRLRDAIVFYESRRLGIPLVWNLAGGYQFDRLDDGAISIGKVLAIHRQTLQECVRAYQSPQPSAERIRQILGALPISQFDDAHPSTEEGAR
jgi:acetoin utilization deacetylase AcuC-like enzyme